MRVMTVCCMFLVLSTVFIEARFWPIASAIGQTIIAFCNLAVWSFAVKSIDAARTMGISTAGKPHTRLPGLISFGEWVPGAFFYAAVVWFVGILIYVGVLHDIAVYAIMVASVNVFLFYVIKCGGVSANDIRIALARAYTVAERVRIIEDVKESTHDESTTTKQQRYLPIGAR